MGRPCLLRNLRSQKGTEMGEPPMEGWAGLGPNATEINKPTKPTVFDKPLVWMGISLVIGVFSGAELILMTNWGCH
eukprot:g31972.t1